MPEPSEDKKKTMQESLSAAQQASTQSLNFSDIAVPEEYSAPKNSDTEANPPVQVAAAIPQTMTEVQESLPLKDPQTEHTELAELPNEGLDLSQLGMAQVTEPVPEAKVDLNAEPAQTTQGAANQEDYVDPQVEKSSNIMLSANAEEDAKAQENQVDLTKLNIPKEETISQPKKIELGESGVGLELYGRKFEISYRRIFFASFFVTTFFVIISIVLWSYNRYIKLSLEPQVLPPYDELIKKYDEIEVKASKYLWFSDYDIYANKQFLWAQNANNLQSIMDAPKLSYVHKKNIIQKNINTIADAILTQFASINTIKQDITKYGFISQELYDLLQNQKQMQPIKQSLLSLEAIKFSSAMRVFSYLDTFLEGFSVNLGLSIKDVESKLYAIMERGENDIYVYLNNCYLNPFERDYECQAVGDFDLYYDTIKKDSSFDQEYFKKLINYIDLKLEQTEIPSFSIVFRKFDPSKQTITFGIDVNTFQKDEIALLQKNILNPHVFIVTQLLNFLRQSMFVVGESIDIKSLDVQEKIVQIGAQQFVINNSQMNFTLPIQKITQREIFDFSEEQDIRYQGSSSLSIQQWSTQDHAVAATTNTGTSDAEIEAILGEDTSASIYDETVEYSLSEKYARLLLDAQQDNARIQYLLQEQGMPLTVQNWAATIEDLQNEDGYTVDEISEVFNYLLIPNVLDSMTVDVSLMRTQNADGQTLFQVFLDKLHGATTEPAMVVEETTESEQSTWFREMRNYFESGNTEQ